MKYRYCALRVWAAVMALLIGACAPAGAEGLLDWLFPTEETAVPASAVALPTEAPIPETPAPDLPDSTLEDDGMLRVYLRSLNDPQALNLTFAGSYAVEGNPGFRFDRNSQATLTAGGGSVWLAMGGLRMNLGLSVTFTRHAVEAGMENGLYIAQSEKETLYCGDLTVSAASDGLRAVLAIPVEEYLKGVVAYEMSDSFPLEALKAQAVAARTYAMQRKWRAGSRDYDVVDTTADQVFKGYDPQYTNVIEAVTATEGVVGTWNGGFATCYYTASNGGQTALPSQIWGSADDDGYLAMADDPYDVENPRSLQNDLTIAPDGAGSAKLKSMLETALGEVLAGEGLTDGDWRMDGIVAIEPTDPKFPDSRMCRKLAFDVKVSARTAALPTQAPTVEPASTAAFTLELPTVEPPEWTVLAGTRRVSLDVYDQIKDGLSLGLNGGDYELVSVETDADSAGAPKAFTIILRRFGHGVGMSQRGAQWMAGHYGKGWREILAFYYPGMTLERMAWPDVALTDLDALGDGALRPLPTATPTPAPLPALEDGEHYATVTLTTAGSTLNVRQEPSTSARIVDQLTSGRRVIVSGAPDADGWVPVRTAEIEGFVKAEYLVDE